MLNLDSRYYSDPALYGAERSAIFQRSWQLLGSSHGLAKPGDFLAAEIAGFGVVIVRGANGGLNGFHNVCRHRGSRLVHEGTGHCDQLRCPYHGWIYDLDGRLKDTPFYDEPSPFQRSDWPLREIAVKEWRGLVFAALDPKRSFEAETGDFARELEGFPIETYRATITQDFVIDVNWKAYLDQFLECYHVPLVHSPDKAENMNLYSVEPHDQIMRMTPPDGVYYGLKWLWVWPNWTLSLTPGGMKTSRVDPIDAHRCRVHFIYSFADISPEGDAARRKVADATASIFAEDVRAAQRAQKNYSSGAHTPGPYHPKHERVVAYFHGKVREALSAAV